MEKISKELERGGLVVFILFTIGNGLNYLFQIIMGRMLSVEDFGTLNALLSVFMMTAIPSGAITALIAKYLVEYNAAEKSQFVGLFLYRSMKMAIIGCALVSLVGISLSPLIARYLQISTVILVAIIMLLMAINLLLAVTTGAVQGLKHFFTLGFLGSLLPALKLSIGVFFVWLGFRLFGALTAIALGILITLGISVLYLKRKIDIQNYDHLKLENEAYVKFFFSAFSLSACMAVLMNLDMVLIKHYLPQSEAGLYSPAMVLARIILYAPSALVQVMYPLTVEANLKDPAATYKLIFKVLSLSTAIIGLCIFGLWLSSNFALPLLFGEKYVGSASYILPASLFVVPLCYLTVLMNFSMAVGNTKFLTITMAAGCIINLLLIAFNHSSVLHILGVMTGVGLVIVLINMVPGGLKYRGLFIKEGQQL